MIVQKLLVCLVVLASLRGSTLQSQPPSPQLAATDRLEFDVASVRPNRSSNRPTTNFPIGPGDVYVPNGGVFSDINLPLIDYILFAYKITANHVPALTHQLPGWVTTDRFDIHAKTSKHDATKDEMRRMMRSLLEDRFQLAIHSETQQVPVFGLVLARPRTTGPKLKVHPVDSVCPTTPLVQLSPDVPKTSAAPQTKIGRAHV